MGSGDLPDRLVYGDWGLHVQVSPLEPLLVALCGQRRGQTQQTRFVREDPHDPGPSTDLRMIVFDPVGRGQAPAMCWIGQAEEAERLFCCLLQPVRRPPIGVDTWERLC